MSTETAIRKRRNLRPEDRRNQILDRAQELFAKKGYEAATIADVIAAAEVSKGGFYHYFDSKEALLEALVERFVAEMLSNLACIVADPQLDPFCKLDQVLKQARAEKAGMAPEIIRMFGAVFRPGNEALFDRVRRAGNRKTLPVITEILKEGAADGTFNVADPEMAAHLILHLNSAIQDFVSAAMFAPDPEEREQAREQILRLGVMQGVTIDRMLGLPDGSIVWLDRESLDSVLPEG